jgi:hypothetical protein
MNNFQNSDIHPFLFPEIICRMITFYINEITVVFELIQVCIIQIA